METNEVLLARIDERVTGLTLHLADFRSEVRAHLSDQDVRIESLPQWKHAATAVGTTGLAAIGWAVKSFIHR